LFKKLLTASMIGAAALLAQSPGPVITTGQYNNSRTSANLNETVLNTSNVNVNQFGKLFSWSVDGWVFAQPLYAPGIPISGASNNVVFVATMHNSVYAFNADNPSAPPLWQVNLGSSVPAPTSNGCPSSNFTGPELGILSTPVIDQGTNTLYAVSASPSGGGYVHSIHALDITTGQEKFGGPVLIQPTVPGNGYDAVNGAVSMAPLSTVVQRTSLLLSNGQVYAGFGNCGPDSDPWHGWVVAYHASNLTQQVFAFNSTPNGGQGGIWQSGRGLVSDASGYVYFNTGNATGGQLSSGDSSTDATQNDYPMRFVQLSPAGQFVASYPPPNYSSLNTYDLDFSSSGPLAIPGTNLLVTGGKDGVIYVFDSSNLNSPHQTFQAAGGGAPCSFSSDGCDQIHDLAFWNSTLYVWGSNDVLRAYTFNSSTRQFNATPVSNTVSTGYHPASLAVSANSLTSGTGITWALTPDNTVHAFNASNVASELWNSNQNSSRDALPSSPRFTEPTIANGRVYVATSSNQVAVYGLLSHFSISTPLSSLSVNQGSARSFPLNVTGVGGFNAPITFSTSGLPAGATISYTASSLTSPGSVTATVNAASSTPTGTYNLIITGSGGSVSRTASLQLLVTTSDTTPPQWACCTYSTNGTNLVSTYSIWDTSSGLKSIQPVQLVNATANIPSFTVGTTSTVTFTVTASGWSSYAKFQLTDVAGNISYVDPVLVDARQTGTPTPFAVKDVTPDEGIITVINGPQGQPGLRNFRIDIDSGLDPGHIQVAGLKDGEIRIVNITSSLPVGGATLTITPLGKPGGKAVLVFGSSPVAGH